MLHSLGVLRLYPLSFLRCLGCLGLKLGADGRQRLRGLGMAGLLLLRGMAGLLELFLHVLQGSAGFYQRLLGVVCTVAQPLEFFLPHVQLFVQKRTLLRRAPLEVLLLQECRLELRVQMDIVLFCCSSTLGGLFIEGLAPC